jgi:hypothetical protein
VILVENYKDKIFNDKSKVSKQVSMFRDFFLKMWWDGSKEFPVLTKKSDYWDKRNKEKQTDKFINEFVMNLELFPEDEANRIIWKRNIKSVIDNFFEQSDLITMREKEILLSDELIESTEKFINEAKEFNSNISFEELSQALRNLWIINIIQMLLSKDPKFTAAIFSYSMLYPYTDNFLDSADISKTDKLKINENFALKLSGKKVIANNKYEENLFKLVDKIEGEYNRKEYPNVFDSLLCIHGAQIKSLTQQKKEIGPYESDILGISFEKGGTSVLADAYIVNGDLSEEDAKFFFGYGVLLQLCDDLQDIQEDLKNGSMTIFSILANKWTLDNVTNNLINFTVNLLDNMPMSDNDNIYVLKDLIKKNCIQLILFAIAKNKKLYSRAYFKRMEQHFPYRTRYMNNQFKSLKRKYSKIKESYNGVDTAEIIMYALKS